MKITVNVDASPDELRAFFGLPDVQPLQAEILQAIRDNMLKGVAGFDPVTLTRMLVPGQFQAFDTLQKSLWDAFRQRAAAGDTAPGTAHTPGRD